MNDRPRVGIVGGGIGGAAAAVFLTRAGIHTDVYEQAGEIREVGAGVQVSPNAVRQLARVGLDTELAKIAATPDVIWQFHKWRTGEVIFEQPLNEAHRRAWGAPYFLVHRAKLLSILTAALPEGTIRLGSRCVGLEEHDAGVTVRVEGRTDSVYDVVIIADGIQSRLRRELFGYEEPKFSGYFAFRSIAPMEAVPLPRTPATMSIWLGPDRHFVHYPIERGEVMNLVCAVPVDRWDSQSSWAEGTVAEFQEAFAGWHPLVGAMIGAAKQTRKFVLYMADPLPAWTKGRIALLGDAAHPMLSFFAQGSGQAIEDAAVLARCLSELDASDPARALSAYEDIRRPRASAILRDANARLHGYHFPDGPGQEARDERLRRSDPFEANGWVYEHDVYNDVDAWVSGHRLTLGSKGSMFPTVQ